MIAQVKVSGPVADATTRLDISTHSKSGYEYAHLRNGSELKSCDRVGSEQYREALSSLQRRDQISDLTQAIASLKRADEIPVVVSGFGKLEAMAKPTDAITSVVKAKPKSKLQSATSVRKQKAKGRKQLYTHVKTKQCSVVHAVLGKDKIGEWRTPALRRRNLLKVLPQVFY